MIRSTLFLLFFAITVNAAQAQSAAQPDRVVRITTGYHQAAGWEKPLVEGNPNLGHYHWTPQGGYDQGYLHISSPQRPQGSVYTRPVHVSPDAYIPKNRDFQPLANHIDGPNLRRDNLLSGQILPEKKVQAMIAQPMKVATYADYDTRGTILPRARQQLQRDAFSTNESVSGQLVGRGYRRAM